MEILVYKRDEGEAAKNESRIFIFFFVIHSAECNKKTLPFVAQDFQRACFDSGRNMRRFADCGNRE